jgi:hypothetical protein
LTSSLRGQLIVFPVTVPTTASTQQMPWYVTQQTRADAAEVLSVTVLAAEIS